MRYQVCPGSEWKLLGAIMFLALFAALCGLLIGMALSWLTGVAPV